MSTTGLDSYLYAEEYVSGYNFTASLTPMPVGGPLGGLGKSLAGVGMTLQEVKSEPAPPENVVHYRTLLDLTGLADMADPNTPGATVSVCVAYWRKANAIHAWFVDNVQDGVDECQRSYVPKEKVRELRDLAASVAERMRAGDRGAAERLAPRSGFFFGSTSIDEYYLEDLDDTVKQLDRVLNHPNLGDVDLYYQSSW